ncbi:hypothetical protein Droror1_Dr00006405 [Drosera rotundifolia]
MFDLLSKYLLSEMVLICEDRIVFYYTSLRGIRRTYEDCCVVRMIFRGLRVPVDERDISLDSTYKKALQEALKGKLSLPQVFIGEKHIGGAEEIKEMHEYGELAKLVVMCLADLEYDYTNPYESASRINRVILPEFVTQRALCLFYLVTGHWFMFLLCLPYLYYDVRMYMDKQHLVDITEIFNMLNHEKKKHIVKLVYLIVTLFLSLFWLLYSALDYDEYM